MLALEPHVLPSRDHGEAARIWGALETELGRPGLACSWAWTSAWIEHFGDLVPHRFVIGSREGQPRGIALLGEERRRPGAVLAPSRLHVGTAGEPLDETVWVERNRLLAAPHDRAPFAAALLTIVGQDPRWDRLMLDGFLPDEADLLTDGALRVDVRAEDSPLADLRDDEDVLAILPAKRRQRVRSGLRRFGTLETKWATTLEEATDIFSTLVDLHQARWNAEGKPGAFASQRVLGFHRSLLEQLVPRGEAVLFRVCRGEETVGCVYGFVEGERLLFYQGGTAQYDDNRLRAGIAVHVLCMQACRARGLLEYDFMAPGMRYKHELSNRLEQLVWVEMERPRLRMRVRRQLGAVRRRMDLQPLLGRSAR